MTVTEWNPLDDDHRAQQMEREALDALHDETFSVVAPCRSCLQTSEINSHHLCESCTASDESLEGALHALLSDQN